MEIKQLEYFRAIVMREPSAVQPGPAATQPPLSYQMKMLEEELQSTPVCRANVSG